MYNHLMSNGVGCLAIFTFVSILILIIIIRMPKLKIFLFSVPYKTTNIFTQFFVFMPAYMLFATALTLILMEASPNGVDVMWILPLLIERIILIIYEFFAEKSEVRDGNKVLDKNSEEFLKIIRKERIFVKNVSLLSLIVAYIMITVAQIADNDLLPLLFTIGFFYSLVAIIVLKYFIYRNFTKEQNNPTPQKQLT